MTGTAFHAAEPSHAYRWRGARPIPRGTRSAAAGFTRIRTRVNSSVCPFGVKRRPRPIHEHI